MSAPKNNQRVAYLDGMRGVASCAVMLYHFFNATTYSAPESLWAQVTAPFHLGDLGVIAFFVLSGYVIAMTIPSFENIRGWAAYILKRMIRLDPTYWLIIFASIAASLVIAKAGLGQKYDFPSLRDLILNMVYLDNLTFNSLGTKSIVAVGWTLCYEFQFYLFYSVLTFLAYQFSKTNNSVLEAILFVSLALSFVYEFTEGVQIKGLALGPWRFFASGALLSLRHKRSKNIPPWFYLMIIGPHFIIWDLETGAGIVTILAITLCSQSSSAGLTLKKIFSSRILVFTGKISYSLYLVHPLIGNRFLYFASRKFFHPDQFFVTAGFFLTATVISVIASYLVFRLVEEKSVRLSALVYKKLMTRVPT